MTLSDRQTALAEVIGFSALAVGSKLALDPVIWRFSGPITLLLTLLVLSLYRRARGQSWSTAGLRRIPGLRARLLLIPQTLLGIFAILGTGVLVTKLGELAGIPFMQQIPDGVQERWGDIQGNLRLYLVWVALSWVSAGFAEETFFRGFVISRLADAFEGSRFARALAVILAALFFGACHVYYQGLRGLVVTGAIGIALGALFLWYRRNLWPLIVAHALVDTLVFTAHYMNWDI